MSEEKEQGPAISNGPEGKSNINDKDELDTLEPGQSNGGVEDSSTYSNGVEDYEAQTEEERVVRRKTQEEGIILVAFDGETDPLSPRSMGKLRKWMITLIVSASSLCV
jgi:hypothetical protein